jgi:hypothetical protein
MCIWVMPALSFEAIEGHLLHIFDCSQRCLQRLQPSKQIF